MPLIPLRHALHALILLFALLPFLPAQTTDAIIARVNGEPVLLSQLKQAALDQSVPPRALLGDPLHNEAYRKAVTQLVDETLLVQKAGLEEIKADETDIARAVDGMLKDLQNQFRSAAELDEYLARQKLTSDGLRQILTARERRRAFAARVVLKRVQVDTASIDAFVKARHAAGKSVEEVNLSQIIITAQAGETRDALQRRALRIAREAGADKSKFGALAREHTTDPAGREHAGYVGWVDPESLLPELRGQLAAMQPGQLSPPLATTQGLHIILLHARKTPRDLLFSETFAKERTRLITELRRTANVKLYDLEGQPLDGKPVPKPALPKPV